MPTKIQPAITTLSLRTDPTGSSSYLNYVDTARELSKVNRRLYSQSRMYGYQGLSFIWRQNASSLATIECTVRTAGNTWIVQNAHTKGEALWNEMQALVLEDNPSIAGKWHDFKVQLDSNQIVSREMLARDGGGNPYAGGEWNISTYVMPQHEVHPSGPDAGKPLPAEEFSVTLIGADTSTKRSLVKAYEESRATLNPNTPNVPAGMALSFFNLLTDSGSQEPELATVIEAEGNNPPYDLDNYPGSGTNAPDPATVAYAAISSTEVDGHIGPFIAPCGLLQIEIKGYDAAGAAIAAAQMPDIDILLHVAPGSYKGVAAVPMGQ
ncbi:MAG: hypothetical protein [Circular genetic element sp.]|nr:MAG: hypothetical protein [Circular genetic element sp.]